jgi:hypothetical protein
VPDEWHEARVVAIFKKGDDADPANYRPISLLAVAYKVFASILLRRLKAGGAEARVRSTQFGFRSKTGTADALFVARRLLDRAWAEMDGSLLMLLLDWAKAFDRIDPAAMVVALTRFGLPEGVVHMVTNIYTGRRFTVADAGVESAAHQQSAGISQGCPLSPFLFIIVMSVLLNDVDIAAAQRYGWSNKEANERIRDILYADDTLLVERDSVVLQTITDLLVNAGREYGLELHWGKTVLLRVRHSGDIFGPTGAAVESKESAVYLGGLLSTDGLPRAEVSRRIGEAWSTLLKLERVWKHANIPKTKKVKIYESCIEPKLMYGLESLWLRKAERARLDALQARCLRRALGIPHAYMSRVSNASVLFEADRRPLSQELLRRQLNLYGKVAIMDDGAPQRRVLFEPSSLRLVSSRFRRGRGRPRQQWPQCVHDHAVQAVGSEEDLAAILRREDSLYAWRQTTKRYAAEAGDHALPVEIVSE